MSWDASRDFLRDDRETEVTVYYRTHPGSPAITSGPPEACDPGEPPEVEFEAAYGDDNAEVTLTTAELERFEREVMEDPATWEDDGPDPDDWRDDQFDRGLAA